MRPHSVRIPKRRQGGALQGVEFSHASSGVVFGRQRPNSQTRSFKLPVLEIETADELNDTRSACGGRLTEQRAVDVIVWQTKIHMVEDVEEVCTNCKPGTLSHRN